MFPTYRETSDVKFFDENTGILIYYTYPSSVGMFRTTNGGFNWILANNNIHYYDIQKIDSNAMYLVGRSITGAVERIQRTFDRGLTWDTVSLSAPNAYSGLSFINQDTGWISGANELNHNCIWKTTNGGVTLVEVTENTGVGKIFFLKYKVNGEYIGWHYSNSGDDKFWKTTNSGNNWFQITRPPAQWLSYFQFIDENIGWFTWNDGGTGGGIYKTTNGGLNWSNQMVYPGNGVHNAFARIKIINYDTIYGSGGYKSYPNNRDYGLIWKTTNGGINWGYQEPDTSFNNGPYGAIDFINSNTGWAYQGNGIHTTNGGGPIIISSININNENIVKSYILEQNYPNPFNPVTKIRFEIPFNKTDLGGVVSLKVFDITGREINSIIKEKLNPGTYEVIFDGSKLASGVYFYNLTTRNISETKKMILMK
ncbi:MAG TPA: T9SS type A sorting domain-containing protein [Ignavibacteria bacterium]